MYHMPIVGFVPRLCCRICVTLLYTIFVYNIAITGVQYIICATVLVTLYTVLLIRFLTLLLYHIWGLVSIGIIIYSLANVM